MLYKSLTKRHIGNLTDVIMESDKINAEDLEDYVNNLIGRVDTSTSYKTSFWLKRVEDTLLTVADSARSTKQLEMETKLVDLASQLQDMLEDEVRRDMASASGGDSVNDPPVNSNGHTSPGTPILQATTLWSTLLGPTRHQAADARPSRHMV